MPKHSRALRITGLVVGGVVVVAAAAVAIGEPLARRTSRRLDSLGSTSAPCPAD
jgi:hypothetical protein